MTAKRLSQILIALLCVGLVILIIITLFMWGQVRKASDNVQINKASVDQITLRLASLQKLQSAYQDDKTALSILDVAMPQFLGSDTVTASLQDLARRAGVNIEAVHFKVTAAPAKTATPGTSSSTTPTATATDLGFTVKVSGNYAQVSSFLAGFNNLTPITDLTSLTMSVPTPQTDSIEMNVTGVSHGS